jgi:hypothetical protein
MALTVSQIMQVAAPSVIQQIGKPYKLLPITEAINHHGYVTNLINLNTGFHVSIVWSVNEEVAQNTESKKIEFVKHLLKNAIQVLDMESELRPTAADEEVKDVDFGE